MNLKMITNRKKYASIFKKAICVLTAQLFIVSNLSFAAADMEPVGGPDSKAEKSALAVNTLSLPRDFGTIKERSIGGNGKMVIYIQDAHCNYEAQTNIAKILEYLIKNYNVDFVAVEGADGVVDTSWFKAFPDEDIKKEVADYFMKKGEITGAEFLSITSDYPFTIYGAEDKKYYIENLTSFLESYPYKQEFLKYYTDIKGALEKLKTYIYTKDLRALDLKEAEHKDKKLKFADYVQFLKDTADSKKISIKPFANFNILTEALKFEKNINFDTVNEERAALIDELSKKLSKDALSELVNQSLAFKLGKTDNNTFYSYLAGLAKEKDIVISEDYPNLAQYLIYSRIYSKVDNEKLFEEIDALLASLKESMFTNDDQRALDKLSKDANVTLGFMNIELTNKEYEYYLANKGGFAPSNFTEFINRQSGRLGLSYNIDVPDEKLNNAFNKLIDFYEIALERDGILVGNMLKGMKGKKTDVAVLITGGFHTKGITRHLKDKDASYVVISPTITQDTESPYIAVLTGQKTPFEELIIGKPEVAEVTQLGNAYISDDMLDNFLARIPNYPAAQQDIRDLIKNIKAARRNTLEIYAAAYMAAYLSVYGMDQDYAGMLAFFEIQYETRTGQPRGNLKQVYEYMKGPEAQRAFDELKTTGQTGAIRLSGVPQESSAFVEGLRANAGTVETLITNVTKLSRVENGIVAGVGLKDIHGRVFTPDNRFFTAESEYTKELNAFVESLSDKSVREMIAAGIMYYDIRSKFWRDNPAFTVAFALAFAKKLQEKEGKQDGIVLHIAVDGYKKHFETAQIFADALLRTGIFDNGGGVYYWGVINGGDIRNYAQAYRAINKEGGNWVYFTMSHRPEDFLGSKLGMGAEVYCGSDVRHCEGVESGTLYDAIIERDFAPITHAAPDPGKIITIESAQKNNNRVAADMIRATSAPKDMPDNELLKGLSLGVDMGGSPIAQNLVNMLRSLGVTDLVVDHSEVTPDYSTEHIIDPNEHESAAIARIKERARQTKRTWLAVDPDGDRGSIVVAAYYKTTDEVRAYSMTGSELLVLAAENLAINYKAKGLGAPTIISDMRTGLAIKDLEKALNERGYPINVVPHEAGYPFFMRGMAKLNAAVAVENTCHTFTNPLTNSNWGAPEEHNYPGYQGGDNAALFLIYLLGCMKHQWEGRDPISQLQWIRREYGLKDTVVQERKPSLPTEHDKYKYVIADKMKELAVEWFPSSQDEYVINFGDPNVTLVSGVHITHYSIDETTSQRRPDAMILVRFSNTGAGFTISGEGYKEDDLKRMLALGHKLMVTAVNELRGVVTTKEDYKTNGLPEGKQFVFFENDAADLAGKFDGSALQQLQAEFDPAKVGVMYSDTEIGMAQGPTVPRREEGIAELTDVLDNDYLRSVPMIIQNGENVIYLRVDSNLAKIARRCGIDDIEALIGEAVRESLAEGVRGPGAFKGLEVNTITIALLNKSKSPFEDGVQNGFIGVHEALFLKVLRGEVKKEVLEVELAVGITHEFRHEAGEMNECALTLEDIKFVQRLAKEKGVSVFQIQEHMRTFSREGSLFMQKLDELVMLERVEKARDIMPKTVAKYERKDNGTSEAVYLGVIDGKVVERYNLTMGGILPSESLAAGQRQRIFVDKGDEVYIYDRVTGSSIPVLEGEFAAIELKDYDIVTSSGPTTVYVEYEFGPAEGVIQTICENVTPFKGRLLEGPKIKYVCPQNAFKGDSDDEGSMPAAKAFLEEHLHIQAEIIPYTSSLEDVKDKIDLTAKDEHIVVVATRDVLEKADTENPGFVKDLLTKACKMPPITDINDKDKLQDKSFYMLEVLAAGAAVAVTNVADADDLAQLQNIFLALTGESLEREYIYYYLSFGKVQHMLPKGVTLSYAIQQINRWLLKMPAKSEIAGMQDKLDARRKLVYSL